MSPTFIIGLIIAGLVLYIVSVYNSLVSLRTRIKAAIQEIGNQLKRQAGLIPNLETSAKAYLKHEKDLFKLITEARKMVSSAVDTLDPARLSAAAEKIGALLPRLQAVLESTPQIKGADVITRLMDELRDTADKVMYSRRTLIDLVADYNIRLVTFPTNLVANAFSFSPEKGLETPTTGAHLQVSESEIKSPKVNI